MVRLFDRAQFNAVTLQLAGQFEARANAPGTLAELLAVADAGALPVWDGASDRTIYGDARVNHAARAWHDRAHIAGRFAFTLAGETMAAEFQIRQLFEAFPSAPSWAAELIRAEVTGQAEILAATGHFVADQIAFSLDAATLTL